MISTLKKAQAVDGVTNKVPIAFPEELYEWLRETAFKRRSSMAEIVREAVALYREDLDAKEGKRN